MARTWERLALETEHNAPATPKHVAPSISKGVGSCAPGSPAGSTDAVAAQPEEVVVDPHTLQPKHRRCLQETSIAVERDSNPKAADTDAAAAQRPPDSLSLARQVRRPGKPIKPPPLLGFALDRQLIEIQMFAVVD
jgi:hypothetical protein